ncbi:hypothetical protein [Streptomyces sp. NPDC088785]|uniref:hypothetical protein n=1 Tax=Streptomyces sp. NPDC088785 TaxID=3365897 RepID=UPI0038022439
MSWGDVRTVENWREDALPGHTHDPHEVTIQLDGAGRLLSEMIAAGRRPGEEIPGREPAGDKEVPVFVDDSGRRGRTFRRVGVALGLACAVYAVVIVVTLFSGSSAAPVLPGFAEDKKSADQVDTSPRLPADSATPTAPAGTTPDPSASGSATDAPEGSADGAAPSAGASGTGRQAPDTATTGPGRPTGRATTKPAGPSIPADDDVTTTGPSATADPPPVSSPTAEQPVDDGPGGTDAVAYRTATRTSGPRPGTAPTEPTRAS